MNILEGTPSIDDIAHDQFCQLWHLWDSCMDQVYCSFVSHLLVFANEDGRYAFGWVKLSPEERKVLVTSSHKALEDFYHEIDPRLQLRKDHVPESAVWFQMAYHAALLLIHRPFLNEPSGSSTLEFSLRSATSAAVSISRIIRGYRNHYGFTNVAPQVIDCILSAAVIHLLNATSGRTTLGRQSANGIKSCVEALLDMQPKWKIRVQRSIRRIQELAHRWKVVWALPIFLSKPLAQETVNPRQPIPNYPPGSAADGDTRVQTSNDVHTLETDDNPIVAGIWNSDQFVGALDQIHSSWGMLEPWDLDMLFQQEDPGMDLSVYGSEPG
jgi:hypothetical protein